MRLHCCAADRVSTTVKSQHQAHLFFPYQGATAAVGGSQMRALEIARGLREQFGAQVSLWATSSRLAPDLRQQHGVRWFAPWCTARGSFVFIGTFWRPKPWLQRLRPHRLSVLVNDMNVDHYRAHLPLYRQMDGQARIAFTSATQRHLFGADAVADVDVSPIDLQRFTPATGRTRIAGQLRIGRHSRDTLDKHHFLYDPELYAALLDDGVDVELMGAQCIAHLLPANASRLRIHATGSIDAADYLRSLDCFIYRTGTFYDTAARAVREAMACGLPVVCHRFGGHVEDIVHGENGFVFDEQREAIEIVRRLRDDIELRRRIGTNARRTMEALFAPSRLRAMYQRYLGVEHDDG